MKKRLFLVYAAVLMLCCTACGKSKTPITAADFTNQMESAGFDIQDATGQFAEGEVESVTLAMCENYQLEFYVLPSKEQAAGAYEQNRTSFENVQGAKSSHVSVTLGNYGYYYRVVDDRVFLISYIDNTLLYCVADSAYADEIKEYAKEAGYL
ncbi:MAG: hypothetical protein GX234_00995 [Clostridiales bacterium]|nr:hypothetical protein [Clostridiales bacterium]